MNIVRVIAKKVTLVITCFIFVILLLAMYTKVKMIVTKQDYPVLFGYTFFQVASGSMEPTLSVNDLILVKVTDNIKDDDIISYNYNGTIITHRVISSSGQNVIVKGDANNASDAPIQRSDIIGKVVKIYPNFAIWLQIFSQPHIIFFVLLTLLLFDFAFSYKPKKKKEKPVTEQITESKPEVKQKKDVILEDDLMDLTQQINIDELNEILAQEKKNLKKQEEEPLHEDLSQEYTVRLDLKQIQQNISKNIK